MYPFLDVAPGTGTGVATSTVDILDDIVSLSNIYPAAGWPASAGSIAGTITYTDGTSQIAGINVVARNVANPFRDAVAAMSGDVTRAFPGTQGQYRLNGLTPGAQYVVYVDGIVAGGFSTPPAAYFPGAEEFFSGASESGNATTDAACVAETITAAAGATTTANIAFNTTPGAPDLKIIGPNAVTYDMTQRRPDVGRLSRRPHRTGVPVHRGRRHREPRRHRQHGGDRRERLGDRVEHIRRRRLPGRVALARRDVVAAAARSRRRLRRRGAHFALGGVRRVECRAQGRRPRLARRTL